MNWCYDPETTNTTTSTTTETEAVLITGGHGDTGLDTAELYLPSSGLSCSLPSLPDQRWHHSVESSGLLCGGRGTPNSCLQWRPDNGTWEESLTLSEQRHAHVSWTPGAGTGTFLMGAYNIKNTT